VTKLNETVATGLNHTAVVGANRTTTVGIEDHTVVGARYSVSIARGITGRLARDLDGLLQGPLGPILQGPLASLLGLIPITALGDNPAAEVGHGPLPTLGGSGLPGAVRSVIGAIGKLVRDPGPLPTTFEMTDRRIVLTTGEASIILDGPNITLEASGNIMTQAGNNVGVLADNEAAIAGQRKVLVLSKNDDVIVQSGGSVHLNPHDRSAAPPVEAPAESEAGQPPSVTSTGGDHLPYGVRIYSYMKAIQDVIGRVRAGSFIQFPDLGLPGRMKSWITNDAATRAPRMASSEGNGEFGSAVTRSYEAAMRASILASSNVKPVEVYQFAMAATGGNHGLAILSAHNLLKNVAQSDRDERLVWVSQAQQSMDRALMSHLVTLRRTPGDEMGPWYHIFAIGLLDWVSKGTLTQLDAFVENLDLTNGMDGDEAVVNTFAAQAFTLSRGDVPGRPRIV